MTDKELWELRLSLIKDVMTLTDKQVQYIINQLNAAQGPAGVHTEALPIYLTIAALALLLAFLAGCAVTIRCAVPVGAAQNTNGYIISYRYGGYWLNELYEGRTEQ